MVTSDLFAIVLSGSKSISSKRGHEAYYRCVNSVNRATSLRLVGLATGGCSSNMTARKYIGNIKKGSRG